MHIQRVVTVYNVEVDGLPQDLQVLSSNDKQAIEDSAGYFKMLAEEANYDWLRTILERCSESAWHLEFYSIGDEPFVPYFRFYWGGGPAICLPRNTPLRSDLPSVLKHFYTLLAGFQENEFGCAGGLERPESLQSTDEMGIWISSDNKVDPKTAIAFLDTFSGDHLCYLPDGRGAWLKNGIIEPVQDLEAEIARYFEALLEGTRI